MTKNLPNRRSIRLQGYDYSQEGLYFITICVQGKVSLFGEIVNDEIVLNEAGRIINDEWQYLKTKYPHIELHEYVIMPNHFHGIIEIVGARFARPHNEQAIHGQANLVPTVGNIIGYFKYQTTKKINLSIKLWQRNYYEHIIRNEQAYRKITEYILSNPHNWEKDNHYNNQQNEYN